MKTQGVRVCACMCVRTCVFVSSLVTKKIRHFTCPSAFNPYFLRQRECVRSQESPFKFNWLSSSFLYVTGNESMRLCLCLCVCQCPSAWAKLALSALFGTLWPVTWRYCGDVIFLSYCQTLLCSFIHFKMVRRERKREEEGEKKEKRQEEVSWDRKFWGWPTHFHSGTCSGCSPWGFHIEGFCVSVSWLTVTWVY